MSDEYVQASPEVQKRRRKHKRRWTKPRKKCKFDHESVELRTDEATINITDLSAIDEGKEPHSNYTNPPLDISALYDDQLSENEFCREEVDLLAGVKLLEQAAKEGTFKISMKYPKENIQTQEFIPACDLPQEELDSPLFDGNIVGSNAPMESQSLVSESQLAKICEAADLIIDIKKEQIQFSQWDSPLKKSDISQVSGIGQRSQSPEQNPVAQAIIDDFNELCSSQNKSPQYEPSQHHESPEFKFQAKCLRTYSRKRGEREKRQKIARKLIHHYDSDSKSSLSSDQSVQSDELFDCSPAGDDVDLNKSSRVCENLQNLSSFFSQSFTQTETESVTDGIYRHIMLMKTMRWDSRLLDWYRSAKNFKLSESLGSSAFGGFQESEIDYPKSEFSHRSNDNMQDFLDDDEDVFQEVGAGFMAGESKAPVAMKAYSDKDIENVLESADKVLAEVTQHLEMKDRLKEKKVLISAGSKVEEINSEKASSKVSEYKNMGFEALDSGGNNLMDKNANKNAPSIQNFTVNLGSNLVGFQTASGKTIKVSDEGIQKANNIFTELETWTDEDLLGDFKKLCDQKNLRNDTPFTKPKIDKKSNNNNKSDNTVPAGCNVPETSENLNLNRINASKKLSMHDKHGRREYDVVNPSGKGNFQKPLQFGGFQSASGKTVSISENALAKAQLLFIEVEEDKCLLNKLIGGSEKNEIPKKSNQKISCGGNNLETSIQLPKPALNFTSGFSSVMPICAGGFQSASGKNIKVSAAAMEKAKNIFSEISDVSGEDKIIENLVESFPISPNAGRTQNSGFKNCKENTRAGFENLNRKIIVSNESVEKRDNTMFSKVTEENSFRLDETCKAKDASAFTKDFTNKMPAFVGGFQSASGKDIKISIASLEKAKNFYNEIEDFDGINETEKEIIDERVNSHKISSKCDKANIAVEPENLCNISKIYSKQNTLVRSNIKNKILPLNSNSNCITPLNTPSKSNNLILQPSALNVNKNSTPLQCKTERNSNMRTYPSLKISSRPREESTMTPTRTKSNCVQLCTPDLKEFFNSVQTSTPHTSRKKNFSLTQEISASTAALLEDELNSSSVMDDMKKICWDEFDDSLKENKISPKKCEWKKLSIITDNARKHFKNTNEPSRKISERVRSSRHQQREKQQKCIKDKESLSCPIVPGTLFMKKGKENRIRWKDLIGNQKPNYFTPEQLHRMGVDKDIAYIQFSNATSFKFKGLILYPEIAEKDHIELADGVRIIPDDCNEIGLHEIEQAFLAMRGVSPNLIPHNWVEHHFKMLLLKYSWLEKSFPAVLSNQLCTPENIILQLKYRYDREIDRTERSALKKILERDDSSTKRMVLLVIDIYQNNVGAELELTDWWYSVRTTVDLAMHDLIRSGKVRIGTKLMIQNAELLNCVSGCNPLEIPPQVRLKIHTNSTRRAKWDIKLGLYKIPRPFDVTLNSVKENGGIITWLSLYILRVYPLVYLSKTDSSQSIHSEKMEARLQKHEEKIDFENFEVLFSQIQREMEHEAKMRKRKSGALGKYIRDIDSATQILELLDEGYELEEIEYYLSPEQQDLLLQCQQEISSVSSRNMQLVYQRVKEHLQNQTKKRSSTEILKVRVIDIENPRRSAVLSIWRPQENLRKTFQEGICFDVSNCSPNGIRYGDFQLNTTTTSEFIFRSKRVIAPNVTSLVRQVKSVSEINSRGFIPLFHEVDTCGLIVMISSPESKKFQTVFICDFQQSILGINFWNGIKEYAYDDVIQINRFITASNLQWRANSGTGVIPCVFATELSTFSENPKTDSLSQALSALKDEFSTTNLIEFTLRCSEKIKNLQTSAKTSGNSFATPVRKSLTSVNTPSPLSTTLVRSVSNLNVSNTSTHIPSPQNRIDRLKMYGTPPAISPLAFKCKTSARRGFKIPRKLTEDIGNDSR